MQRPSEPAGPPPMRAYVARLGPAWAALQAPPPPLQAWRPKLQSMHGIMYMLAACMHACTHACEHEPCVHACVPCLQVPISSHLAAAATPQRAAEFLDALADAIHRRAVEADPAALAAAQNAARSSARRHESWKGEELGIHGHGHAWHALVNALRQTSSTRRP